MSMQTYGLYAPATFLVDPEASAYIILSSCKKSETVPESIKGLLKNGEFHGLARAGKLPEDFSNPMIAKEEMDNLNINCIYCSEFNGNATSCFPESTGAPLDVDYEEDYLTYIPCSKQPNFFQAAYQNAEELLDEFKSLFKENGIEFPPDFDWWAHICEISGTYFC